MKALSKKEIDAIRHIRNWIVHRGRTPSIRELMQALGYKSPRSAQDILAALERKEVVRKLESGEYQLREGSTVVDRARAHTVDIPIVGSVAAGAPILAEENIQGFVPISTSLARPGGTYFLLRVIGDSMNRAGIQDGDFVLVRQQATADSGQRVVALIDDEATVKTYFPGENVVVLQPSSTNPMHKPIVIDHDFEVQGIVVAAIPGGAM